MTKLEFIIEAMRGEWEVVGTIWSLLITIGLSAFLGFVLGVMWLRPPR